MPTKLTPVIAALAFAFAQNAAAAGTIPASSAAGSQLHRHFNLPGKLHKFVGTVIDWNGVVTSLPGGTTVIDTNTVNCANTAGCVIGISVMAQVIASVSGSWSICTLIDGNQGEPGGCPVQGVVPASNYVIGNLRQNGVVAMGQHTVQTEIVMPSAGSIAAWESDYTVYKN